MTIRTRFAPSPTGVLHLGSIRTALFCWLYARRHGGTFVLRIEDTDRARSTAAHVDAILDGMRWLGLDADEGPIFQVDRLERYATIVEDWLDRGLAYRCYCSKAELDARRAEQLEHKLAVRYDGRCRDRAEPRAGVTPVVRFRNPDAGDVLVDDLVRGQVVFSNEQLDDLVIARSDGTPTYNFAVVVDDHDMGITHVIRGDDHLNNTPRQINLFSALEAPIPKFAHLPMILGPDGAKLSKRHGAVDIRDYRAQGFLPEAMLNYLVRLGWSHGDQEVFTIDEMVEFFDIVDVNQSASAFNPEKLRWLNQQHIMRAESSRLGSDLLPFLRDQGFNPASGPDPTDIARAFQERAETLQDMAVSARFCYADFAEFDAASAKKHLRPVVLQGLQDVRKALAALDEWSCARIESVIKRTAEAQGMNLGKLGQPIRVSVTGGPVSPPLDTTLWLIGQDAVLQRLDRAIEYIEVRKAASS